MFKIGAELAGVGGGEYTVWGKVLQNLKFAQTTEITCKILT